MPGGGAGRCWAAVKNNDNIKGAAAGATARELPVSEYDEEDCTTRMLLLSSSSSFVRVITSYFYATTTPTGNGR